MLEQAAGFELWFALRDTGTGVFGIFRLSSGDGVTWRDFRQVLPRAGGIIPDLASAASRAAAGAAGRR